MPNTDDNRCQNVIASLRTHTKRKTFLVISSEFATEEVGQIHSIPKRFFSPNIEPGVGVEPTLA